MTTNSVGLNTLTAKCYALRNNSNV